MLTPIRIRPKGQITLPIEVRRDLGVSEGDIVYLEKCDGKYVISPVQADRDPAAGMLAQYAKFKNPSIDEEKEWVAKHIAETADGYDAGTSE